MINFRRLLSVSIFVSLSLLSQLVRRLTKDLSKAAHTVVIKGVQIYQNGVNVEYSDLDVMQMLGRAVSIVESRDSSGSNNLRLYQGRPQFG